MEAESTRLAASASCATGLGARNLRRIDLLLEPRSLRVVLASGHS